MQKHEQICTTYSQTNPHDVVNSHHAANPQDAHKANSQIRQSANPHDAYKQTRTTHRDSEKVNSGKDLGRGLRLVPQLLHQTQNLLHFVADAWRHQQRFFSSVRRPPITLWFVVWGLGLKVWGLGLEFKV
jgi:hypothetical protein